MADPRLTIIADAVLARIAAITIAGGYNFTAGTTGRQYRGPDGHAAYPAAFIKRVRLSDRASNLLGDSARVRRAEAIVEVQLYTVDADDPQKQLELWAYDCVRAVEATPYPLGLETYVLQVGADSFDPLVTDLEIAKPFGSGVLTVRAPYDMGRGAL